MNLASGVEVKQRAGEVETQRSQGFELFRAFDNAS